jgi:Na+/proline symporter|tara:strand:- start:910 stop:2409 length:1500 start_codon:yes stop_codon:yes gene_type:complete
MNTFYLSQSITITILILTSIIFAGLGIYYSRGKTTISSYIAADRSIGRKSLTASLTASCFGVWILIGPSEAATWGGIGAVIGYALGQALPFLAFIAIGKRMRKIMPEGNSLTQFVHIRFGGAMFKLVLALSVFYMFVYLCAEVTAIAKIVNLISGFPLWQTSLLIIVSTLIYTLYGGLRASIFTDKIQFVIIFIFLIIAINQVFISETNAFSSELIEEKAATLISGKYFYGYTAGITFFIAVFATNLFDQGVWQRVYAAKSNRDLEIGFASAFVVILPFLLILGFFGILAVTLGNAKDPSTVFFSLLLNPMTGYNSILTISILVLALSLVISSIDTLINAISSLVIINGSKFLHLQSKALKTLSFYLIIILSFVTFIIASKGFSVLFMFLFADLLCCAAVFPVFYGMFNENISKKLGFYSVLSGLISGILLFPDQTFSKSILIGNLIPTVYFPSWISTALLFWSFIVATFVPMIVVFTNIKKTNHFSFKKISQKVKRIR